MRALGLTSFLLLLIAIITAPAAYASIGSGEPVGGGTTFTAILREGNTIAIQYGSAHILTFGVGSRNF